MSDTAASWSTSPTRPQAVRRRLVQGLSLAVFILLFFVLVDAARAPSQLAYRMRFNAPAFLLCLADPLAAPAAFAAARALPLLALVPLAVLAASLLIPRFFCSRLCPMGTLIDLAGLLRRRPGRSLRRLKFAKYGLLAGAAAGAAAGLPLAAFITPLPLLCRASGGLADLASGLSGEGALWLAAAAAIIGLSLVRRRFWCNYLCPSGALVSLVSRFSLVRRRRSGGCNRCGRCAVACDFDAVLPETFDAGPDCACCGACARVCKQGAIDFALRRSAARKAAAPSPAHASIDRRQFIAGAAIAGGALAAGWPLVLAGRPAPHRPPGALPEDEFLARCLRCGLCARNCPGPAISPMGIESGLATWGTPEIVPWRAGCSPACNNCGRVCPTGAIRHLPLERKNLEVMGTARHRKDLCLPWREEDDCVLCRDICAEAGHHAITSEERVVYLQDTGEDSAPGPMALLHVPSVDASKCVGCGLCVMICRQKNVVERKTLSEPAIAVTPKGQLQ